MKRIGILCSGGDSQGMNTATKIIVNMCSVYGLEVMGIRRGYQGLLEEDMSVLTNDDVQNISNLGGSFLKVARSKEFATPQGTQKAADILQEHNISVLIVIGGNGSYRGALALSKLGVKIIALPGTIDNDLFYTERTLGFDTAVNNAVRAIDDIRQTMEANDRAVVLEVMGRECGDIALHTAVAVQAHSVALPETKTTINEIVDDVHKVLKSKVTKSPVIILSEAVQFSVSDVEQQLHKQLKIDTRGMNLSYLLRGGAPSVMDRTFATQLGILSVELINSNQANVALGMENNQLFAMDLEKAVNMKKGFDYELHGRLRDLYKLNDLN